MYNFDQLVEKNSRKYKDKDPLAPKWPFRMLITGPSGCGKTNTLLEMILTGFLHFDKIYLYAKNIQQDKYQFLIKTINELEEAMNLPKNSMIYACSKIDDVIALPDPDEEEQTKSGLQERRQEALRQIVAMKEKKAQAQSKPKGKGKAGATDAGYPSRAAVAAAPAQSKAHMLDPEKQNLVIFDDFISEKNQHIIENYFVGSRHSLGEKKCLFGVILCRIFSAVLSHLVSFCSKLCQRDIQRILQNLAHFDMYGTKRHLFICAACAVLYQKRIF